MNRRIITKVICTECKGAGGHAGETTRDYLLWIMCWRCNGNGRMIAYANADVVRGMPEGSDHA